MIVSPLKGSDTEHSPVVSSINTWVPSLLTQVLSVQKLISACICITKSGILMLTGLLWGCFILDLLSIFLTFLKNRKHQHNIEDVCGKIAGGAFNDLQDIYCGQILKRAQQISSDPSHPLWDALKLLPSGCRFTVPKFWAERFKNDSSCYWGSKPG